MFAYDIIISADAMQLHVVVQERRRDLLRTLAPQQEPQLVVDTATVNWQVLQANAAAKESIGLVEEGGLLGGLWDLFAGAPQTEVGSSSAGINPWIFSRYGNHTFLAQANTPVKGAKSSGTHPRLLQRFTVVYNDSWVAPQLVG